MKGVANQSDLMNVRLREILQALGNQSDLINRKIGELITILQKTPNDDGGGEGSHQGQTEKRENPATNTSQQALQPIVTPTIDLAKSIEPIGEILAAPPFNETVDFFARSAAL